MLVNEFLGKEAGPVKAYPPHPLYLLVFAFGEHMGLILTCIRPAKTFPLKSKIAFEFLFVFLFYLKTSHELHIVSHYTSVCFNTRCCFSLLMSLADPLERGPEIILWLYLYPSLFPCPY